MGEVNGSKAERILSVPVVAALLTLLPWRGRLRGVARAVGAGVAVLVALVASGSVGMFFAPSALFLVLEALPLGWAPRPPAN
ncbi:MAG TPA: hypothetical protein VHE78_11625 [Gemmatimonadaceae bacterium]|nr:hypothetical protein [Gemmatimonadaceae bacterium]